MIDASSSRDCAPTRWQARYTWPSTVRTDITSFSAISRLDRPATTSSTTARCRPDNFRPVGVCTPPLLTRLLNGYVDRILTATEYDPVAVDRFVKVTALIDPASRLLRPRMIWRAACANLRRPRRDDGQPARENGDLARSVAR